ncbi:uncharacterized protein LOC62_01G000632 [Vanrija pseudolonga]|uniref:SGNH hydrolase-type esterase domain-containing protein n=1 Tax=Vanrija pseudolonga TaxID=143232 RepID=A0AAF0Y3N5_9TREE|nr:hypothetical protein LOC62_01G000632 [Vanrija pseudolonga]
MFTGRRGTARLGVFLYLVVLAVTLYAAFGGSSLELKDGLRLSQLGKLTERDQWRAFPDVAGGAGAPPSTPPPPPPAPVAPVNICTAGPVGKRLCAEWGEAAVTRLVAYGGTNHRIRRALARMRAGKPFSMGTLGGSVSSGHGIRNQGNSRYAPSNLNVRLFSWLNATFPAPGGSAFEPAEKRDDVNVYVNGAEPARGSDYFSMCSSLHLPDEPDLVIIEVAINDQVGTHNLVPVELLIRQMLELPSQPGVLVFNVFGLMFEAIQTGGDLTMGVSQFYDVPTLSLRNAMLPLVPQNKSLILDWFNHENDHPDRETFKGVDLRHLGNIGHEIAGDMMVAYMELQVAEMDAIEAAAGPGWSIDSLYPAPALFPGLVTKKFDPALVPPGPLKPTCIATNSDKAPFEPKTQTGWRKWAWKDKKYLIADEPGAEFEFEVAVSHGTIILYYLRSREFGLGNLECDLVGEPHRRKVIKGYWDQKFNIGQSDRWDGLNPGTYNLKCTLLDQTDDPKGGKEFRLMALMTI